MYLWIALGLLFLTILYKSQEGYEGAEFQRIDPKASDLKAVPGLTSTVVDSPALNVVEADTGTTIKLPNQVIGTVGDDITFGGNVRIKGDKELELGRGLVKEGNAGKIAYNKWGQNQMDIIGAGTDQFHRKINLWDDVEVAGKLDVKGPLAIGSDISGNPGSIVQYDDLMKRTDIKGYGEDGSRKVKLWDQAEVGFLDVKDGIKVSNVFDTTLEPNQNYGMRIKKGLDVSGELNANDRVYLKSELTAHDGAIIHKGMTVNDLLQANDGLMVKDVVDANSNGVIVKKRLVVNDILDVNDKGIYTNKPLQVQDVMHTTPDAVKMKKNVHVDGELVVNQKTLLNDTEVDGTLKTDKLHVNEDLTVDGDIVIGKGTKKWIISVGDRGQLEFMRDKSMKNKRTDTDKGHVIMEPDGNLWMSRSIMRGHVAENVASARGLANNAKQTADSVKGVATEAKNLANSAATVNTAQNNRLNGLAGANTAQDNRINGLAGVNTAQDNWINRVNTAQDTRIQNIENNLSRIQRR